MEKFKVTFLPDQKTIEVEPDYTILQAALSAGISLNATCGGDGVCGRCKVILRKGKVVSRPTALLTPEEKKQAVYLACQTVIASDIEVEIPLETRLDEGFIEKIVLPSQLKGLPLEAEEIVLPQRQLPEVSLEDRPLVWKLYLKLNPPDKNNTTADVERLINATRKITNSNSVQISLQNIRGIASLLRDAQWQVTLGLTSCGQNLEILNIEPKDTTQRNFGFVFDIGTTTITGQLIDIAKKQVLGTKAVYNRQAVFGADVISRIIFAEKNDGLEKLYEAVVSCLNDIIRQLAVEHKIDLNDVFSAVCTGNTTMIHLLLRINPYYIRRQPYVPTVQFVPPLRVTEVGLRLNPRAMVFFVPGISSYVGGDVTSGVLATALDKQDTLGLLIDVGTNGEVALGNKDFLIATSASAGPAFEGSGVRSGMHSSQGAIQRFCLNRNAQIYFDTIGNTLPRGICGSGYIDVLAEFLRWGIIERDGRFKLLCNPHIRDNNGEKEYVIVSSDKTAVEKDIVICESDIENIKRAKAAIYAATSILLKKMSFSFKDLKKIFIAGGFGTSLDIRNAITIGLLPDLPVEVFEFVGNTAIAGASAMLLSQRQFERAKRIAENMAYLELSDEPIYMDEYMAALFFPHTDLERFPSFGH
ncbi:MAG: ASKHA domain-containing protein [Candidatus Omnitrophica bacterium]|nr:ASKHA domain-containing protein [Candidatus Omnitrophota bacterium]